MIDHEKTRMEAKEILDKFASKLEGIKTEETRIEREEDRRNENKERNPIDRKIMMKNAPKVKDDCIEAEKGGWV